MIDTINIPISKVVRPLTELNIYDSTIYLLIRPYGLPFVYFQSLNISIFSFFFISRGNVKITSLYTILNIVHVILSCIYVLLFVEFEW